MIESLISMGILGVLIFIASKLEVINDISHEIRDMLNTLIGKGGGSVPPTSPLPPSYDAEKHSNCYPFM